MTEREARLEAAANARATASLLQILFGALVAFVLVLLAKEEWTKAFGIGVISAASLGLALICLLGAEDLERRSESSR